jgi:hypothetical protein
MEVRGRVKGIDETSKCSDFIMMMTFDAKPLSSHGGDHLSQHCARTLLFCFAFATFI